MYLIPIPVLADNYLCLLDGSKHAPVVNLADAGPVSAIHNRQGLDLESILVTHPLTGSVMPTDLKERASIVDKPDNRRLAVNCRIN